MLVLLIISTQLVVAQDINTLGDTLRISGNLSARNVLYSASGLNARRSPFSYVLGGDVTFSKGEFTLPLSFTYSEQDRSFSQPFNQFGIAPKYKWLTLYLGFQNLNWGTYTLAGHQMAGAGFEVKKSRLNFGAIYGRLRRAVPFDSIKNNTHQATFERKGLAAHVGYGTDQNRFEFTFLKASDDENSLKSTSDSVTTTPAENTAASFKGNLNLFKNFSVFVESAISIYSRNKLSPAYESENLSPIVKNVLKPNISTQFYTAINGGFNYKYRSLSLNGIYKRVAPDFQSMGAYFQENDMQSFGLDAGLPIWKGKGNLNGGITKLRDNIQDKKEVTTHRLIPMLAFSYNNLKHFGMDINTTSVITHQTDGTKQVSDTFKQNLVNPVLSFIPRWTYSDSVKVKTFMVAMMSQFLKDGNTFTNAYSEYNNFNVNLNYSLMKIASFTTYFLSVNMNRLHTQLNNNIVFGTQAAWSKGYKKNTLPVNVSTGFSFSAQNIVINVSSSVNYTIKKRHTLNAAINAMQNIGIGINPKNYREFTFVFSYNYHFGK